MGRQQPASRLEEPAQQRGCHRERGVGDHPVGLAGQAEVSRVRLHDDGGVAELRAQVPGAVGVLLDRDDTSAGLQQMGGEGAPARTDVDDDVARRDVRLSDDPVGPSGMQLVPAPPLASPSHGPAP